MGLIKLKIPIKTIFLFWAIFFSSKNTLCAQQSQSNQPSKATILVVGFKEINLSSNIYYPDELAKINDTTQADVASLYQNSLNRVLASWKNENYKFVIAKKTEATKITRNASYQEWDNFFGESYVALVSDSSINAQIQQLAASYQADYILMLNYYEIHSNSPPAYFEEAVRAMHSIHYDLFDRDLGVASSGVITSVTRDSRAGSMKDEYEMFAQTVLDRLSIYETAPSSKELKKNYYQLKLKETAGYWGIGLSTGWGMPYGGIGLELVKNIGTRIDLNAGFGYANSGLKAGGGFRYYLIEQSSKLKPFVGANFSWASGNSYTMGGRTDDRGNQLDPEDVSKFKILSDRAIHYKVGFRLLGSRQALLCHIGNGLPFKGYKAQFISGKDTQQRRRKADLMAVGGLELGLTCIIYLGK